MSLERDSPRPEVCDGATPNSRAALLDMLARRYDAEFNKRRLSPARSLLFRSFETKSFIDAAKTVFCNDIYLPYINKPARELMLYVMLDCIDEGDMETAAAIRAAGVKPPEYVASAFEEWEKRSEKPFADALRPDAFER